MKFSIKDFFSKRDQIHIFKANNKDARTTPMASITKLTITLRKNVCIRNFSGPYLRKFEYGHFLRSLIICFTYFIYEK